MDKEIAQLVEMGATRSQARAALRQYKDVMQAAERIFEGKFDDIEDVEDMDTEAIESKHPPPRLITPEEDEEVGDEDEIEDDEEDAFVDYDSDDTTPPSLKVQTDSDPYAGIFFSKDRREEVVEVEEEPQWITISDSDTPVKVMTQGQWMKGCPEGGEQSFLFSLYSQLNEGAFACPQGCGASIPREKGYFFAVFPEFSAYIDHLRKIVRQECIRCHTQICIACGEHVVPDKGQRPLSDQDDQSLFHCSDLQGVILGIGLFLIEQMFSEQDVERVEGKEPQVRNTKRRKTNTTKRPDTDITPDDDDDMYYGLIRGKKQKGGIGYAGDQKEDNSGQVEAHALQVEKDAKIGRLLSAVRVYLPNLHRSGGARTSDYMVHPTALAHLRRRFNYVCSALLRNDSLADMSERSILYFELLEWLETISNHEALASMMAMPIMVVASVKSFTTRKSSSPVGSHIRERTIVYEGSSSPRELLEGIAIQAQAALKGLESQKQHNETSEELTEEQKRMTVDPKGKARETPSSSVSEENQKLTDFCKRILATTAGIDRSLRETKGDAFVERLQASLPKVFTSSLQKIQVEAGDTEESAKKAYEEWARRVRFEYCDLTVPSFTREGDDQIPQYKFHFNTEARMLANSDIPKRSLAIAKELAILTTNLPVAWGSSIFLRVDETRVDIIKALITGPEGTPYYNGCYLFDIFLGPTYNHSPPSVKYMTTNGGKYRFNPNLYADGKVCLSLLGTWTGPGWVAGRSTLLQVLISIQSMILCDEPYLNEPGWAGSAGTTQSIAYSANIRRMVVKTAMLGNLKNPPEPFADVIRTHFRLKARAISEQLDRWFAQDDGKPTLSDGGSYSGRVEAGGSSNGFKQDVDEMKQLLAQL
ncbi:hypothetical protein K435DRAFT_740799 [Dendrothele bispora CBS 962.96]|uniref:UBC core domain-containing protein n=1 Tax=Dendrothele bispora (strain CBS 962.96) TaxID=1314807 RepID=A0A4S8N121_DENBC|nr:hypothetical protein K435DRAFT_740799 [Dendrothele bispora CBS 962.96]